MEQDKALLNVAETAAYLNLGKTKTRELMKIHEKVFVVRIGNRSYAHKGLLDKWLLAQVRQ
ncbi:MAG: molybdate-binding protein [Firmicutes bacterium]|nr:molybdate-binding protein [Bacillota bacterium]